jgi:hypothetical protein
MHLVESGSGSVKGTPKIVEGNGKIFLTFENVAFSLVSLSRHTRILHLRGCGGVERPL